MSKDENRLHNKTLHEHILGTWRRDSPRMWSNLVVRQWPSLGTAGRTKKAERLRNRLHPA
jgi:hypothetical protein